MNNIKLTLGEIKKREINILKKIDKICKQNDLKYSLMDGSALGAIRHKGFIPWDDDIDIVMMRDDYDKLRDIFKRNEDNDLLYMSCETQEDCPYPYAKIIDKNTDAKETGINKPSGYGVFIDVFPIDKVPSNNKIKKRYLKKLDVLYKIYFIKIYNNQISQNKIKKLLKSIIALLLKPISLKKLVKKLDNESKKYNNETINDYTIVLHPTTFKKGITYTKEFFEDVSYYPFEDTKFAVINGYDEYLKNVFGDYMQLPPVEARKTNHNWDYIKIKSKQ